MGRKILQSPWNYINKDEFVLKDEFTHFIDGDDWTILDTDSGSSVTHEGAGRSRMKITAETTDNNEAALVTTNELFKFITLVPIHATGLIQFVETDTTNYDSAVAFGFADALGANQIADTAGALAINDSGAMIYKLKATSVWRFGTNIAGGTIVNSTSTTTAGGSSAQLLEIDIIPISATVFQARPFVDGVQLLDATSGDPIQHNITLGTSTDMDFGIYLKTGAAQAENVYADYVVLQQGR